MTDYSCPVNGTHEPDRQRPVVVRGNLLGGARSSIQGGGQSSNLTRLSLTQSGGIGGWGFDSAGHPGRARAAHIISARGRGRKPRQHGGDARQAASRGDGWGKYAAAALA